MKHIRLYLTIVVPVAAAICIALYMGGAAYPALISHATPGIGLLSFLPSAYHDPVSTVLLQLIVILSVAKGLGWIFTRIGQQSVMGEIVGGVLLGPSLLGWLAPEVYATVFPPESLTVLSILSQLGLLLFMFVIGMELDIDAIREQIGASVVISHTSIAVPFLMGVVFAYFSYEQYGVMQGGFTAYALFMGIAMSITAFPVLARIVRERGIAARPTGQMALVCAAINDVTAWCILPVVVAVTKAESMRGVAVTIAATVAFVLLMVLGVKPALQRYYMRQGGADRGKDIAFIAVAILVLLASALVSEIIGIHALFGAFIAGAVLPGSRELRHHLTERLEGVSVSLLLPVFFVITGLRTKIGVLSDASLWPVFGAILLLAVAGKLAGSAAAARLSGFGWRDSLSIGTLMNTRGLMELIVLNIGYDLGVLKAEVFTMMVFMALFTTLMTGPLMDYLDRPARA